MLKKTSLHTNVTALCIVEPKLLLEGYGGFLNIYSLNSTHLLDSIDLFRGSRIHGIRSAPHEDQVIVFGGKHIAILRVEITEEDKARLKVVNKWEETDWIRDAKLTDSANFLVSLTAHNNVLIHNIANFEEVIEIKGEEKCILYSGRILGDAVDRLTILSGTVFGEILVWAVSVSDRKATHYHRLPGHNGVIFSVNYDAETRTIVSTSDDRSVRTWCARSSREEAEDGSDLRAIFENGTISPQHELYGHEARVWNSVIVRPPNGSTLIASLGEDSRVCLWDLPTGALLCKLDAHPGASVWAADWNAHTLVTGGGDGATRLWNEHHIHESPIHQLRIDDDDHTPCQVAITPAGYVAVSRLGTLYLRQQGRWCAMYENELLGSGCVADSDGERLIFGTKAGSVFLFAANGSGLLLEKMHQLERSKIYSVHLVGRQQFIACFDQGKLLLMDSLSSGSPSSRYVLPEAKQRWPSCVLATRHHLIIGDRDGSLHLYSKQSEAPIESHKNVHGKNGITDLKADPSNAALYYTAGKDGRVGMWRLDEDQSTLDLLSITNTSLGWIARLCWMERHLVYLAFTSDRFVVWSSEQQRSLMQVQCGGGHRSWDLSVSSDGVRFVFVKDKHVYENWRPVEAVFTPTLAGRYGGHAKSICSAKFLGGELVLSGSEDTTMRLSRVVDRSIRPLSVIPKHVSSVRALGVKQLNAATWLCVSAGGRAQLCVSLLTVTGGSEAVGAIHHDVKSHFLRGWLRRSLNKPWTRVGELEVVPDPETRYMDVDIVSKGEDVFHVAAACSDSLIRIFELDLKSRHLEPIQELDFHRCCVLKVKAVMDSTGGALLLSAGTRGRLAVWDVTALSDDREVVPLGHLDVHQSGVNGLDSRWLEPDELLVLTGGDDNALICTRIKVDRQLNRVERLADVKVLPHAAQISGVALLGAQLAVSVSLDQRLVLWHFDGAHFNWLDSACCDVADIQGLDVSDDAVCVYGQGVQIFRVSPPSQLKSDIKFL